MKKPMHFKVSEAIEMAQSICPGCGWANDKIQCVSREGQPRNPNPGDVTVCLQCATALVFNIDLTTRKLEPLEYDMMSEAQRAIIKALRQTVWLALATRN